MKMVEIKKDNEQLDERMQILKMIEDGKVTASEGLELLNAVELGKEEIKKDKSKAKWLRVRVLAEDDKTKVNVNLPLSLVDVGLKLAMKFTPELQDESLKDIDFEEILEAIKNGAEGKIVDVYNEEDSTTVEVFIE